METIRHTYLSPMKTSFKGLGSGDLAVCKESFENLKKRLGEYTLYFK